MIDYYVVCDDHHEFVDAVSYEDQEYTVNNNAKHALIPFLIAHCGCHVRILNEHQADEVYGGMMYHKWVAEEVNQEIAKARRARRWE